MHFEWSNLFFRCRKTFNSQFVFDVRDWKEVIRWQVRTRDGFRCVEFDYRRNLSTMGQQCRQCVKYRSRQWDNSQTFHKKFGIILVFLPQMIDGILLTVLTSNKWCLGDRNNIRSLRMLWMFIAGASDSFNYFCIIYNIFRSLSCVSMEVNMIVYNFDDFFIRCKIYLFLQ